MPHTVDTVLVIKVSVLRLARLAPRQWFFMSEFDRLVELPLKDTGPWWEVAIDFLGAIFEFPVDGAARHGLVALREVGAGFACRRDVFRAGLFEDIFGPSYPIRIVAMH